MPKKVCYLHVPLNEKQMKELDKARAAGEFLTRAAFVRHILSTFIKDAADARAS